CTRCYYGPFDYW
nr:immunoglobulin heavy chain junction region [Mus musculus]MBK4198722.1 immunoglobulin heavy chain junction region [Mus musculus]MBK4198723.1 immunoglobulin heavy chain junction region [Mus musculus]MBK4198724.1 immunoglobulin heavy chain junction region [Mus musculus]MBK4198725.1 immunoglobulin heavy chain junction region [Mus musculus]